MADIPQSYWIMIQKKFSLVPDPKGAEQDFNRIINLQRQAAKWGYSLASSEIEELKADNLRLQNALADAKVENEKLSRALNIAWDQLTSNNL